MDFIESIAVCLYAEIAKRLADVEEIGRMYKDNSGAWCFTVWPNRHKCDSAPIFNVIAKSHKMVVRSPSVGGVVKEIDYNDPAMMERTLEAVGLKA